MWIKISLSLLRVFLKASYLDLKTSVLASSVTLLPHRSGSIIPLYLFRIRTRQRLNNKTVNRKPINFLQVPTSARVFRIFMHDVMLYVTLKGSLWIDPKH
jgi:hypothetical protein